MNTQESSSKIRLDKWLWAARFFKTRSLATDAVAGGKVHVNGQRVKPSRAVLLGDEVELRRGYESWTVIVKQLSDKRGSAMVAAELYAETEQSKRKREEQAALRKAAAGSFIASDGRPNKQQRRDILRFKGKGITD